MKEKLVQKKSAEKKVQEKTVKEKVQEKTDKKLEILNTHDINFELAKKGEFFASDFNQYLEKLKKEGILKWTKSPSRIRYYENHKYDIIKPMGDKEGIYYYGAKQNIHAGYEGDIFKSLLPLQKKILANEQPRARKRHSKERSRQDIELFKHFEKLMSEPLKVFNNLIEKVEQEDESIHSPFKLLQNYAKQLYNAIKENNYSESRVLIADLEELGIEYHGEFNREMFENTIVPEAEKHNLIKKTSENQFTRKDIKKATKENRWVMDNAKWEEIYYQSWKNTLGGLLHVDVYTFKGNKNSNTEKNIFNKLKQCARMVGDIDWIKSSITKWEGWRQQESEIPETQRKAAKQKAKKAAERLAPFPRPKKQTKKKKKQGKQKTFGFDELDKLKIHLEEQEKRAEKKEKKKKPTVKKKTSAKKKTK